MCVCWGGGCYATPPPLVGLRKGTWMCDPALLCHAAKLSHENRVVRLKGEGTVLLDPCELPPDVLPSEGGMSRHYVALLATALCSKDCFVGAVVLDEASSKTVLSLGLDRYLPEIGIGVRGGSDKGSIRSMPQARQGGRIVGCAHRVLNFQSGQVVGLVLDEKHRTLEYWVDRVYQGIVFSQLPPGEVRFAVSNGWEGSSAFAILGQCRY